METNGGNDSPNENRKNHLDLTDVVNYYKRQCCANADEYWRNYKNQIKRRIN